MLNKLFEYECELLKTEYTAQFLNTSLKMPNPNDSVESEIYYDYVNLRTKYFVLRTKLLK